MALAPRSARGRGDGGPERGRQHDASRADADGRRSRAEAFQRGQRLVGGRGVAAAGVEDYTLYVYEPTTLDRVLGWLMNPVAQGIFIMLIVGGIYFELQTPGIGFPLVAAVPRGGALFRAALSRRSSAELGVAAVRRRTAAARRRNIRVAGLRHRGRRRNRRRRHGSGLCGDRQRTVPSRYLGRGVGRMGCPAVRRSDRQLGDGLRGRAVARTPFLDRLLASSASGSFLLPA